MSHVRVIPRDLFNDANLLKCLGQVFLNLETANLSGVELEHDGAAFRIVQSAGDGSTWVENVRLNVRGQDVIMFRPLNSRRPWPLYISVVNDDDIPVLDDDGNFSREFATMIGAE